MIGIEEKFNRLSPGAQELVSAFIDFLLSRDEDRYRGSGEAEPDESTYMGLQQEPGFREDEKHKSPAFSDSGIILAEEREPEQESAIDFADINSRFSPKEAKEEPRTQVRQRKMFDWL